MIIMLCLVIKRIDGILVAFLWKVSSLSHLEVKTAWASVCYPFKEGGLGIKWIKTWNKAVALKHMWRLFFDRSSVYLGFVQNIFLRGRYF